MPAYNYYGGSYGSPYGAWGYPQNGFQAQPIVQQPMQVPQAQPTQAPQTYSPMINSSGIIWVSGAQEAQMYPIAPNNAVALWEKSGKTIYLKQADATGKPTITVFDLVERKDGIPESNGVSVDVKQDFATKDDLGKVVNVVQGLNELVGSIKTDVDSMRGDMYGIAGQKKKAVRKSEVAEDDA